MADGRGAPRDGAPDGSHGGEETPEDEPRLKYQRLGSSCAELLAGTAASCLRVEDKMLALGTQCGSVYLLDFNGNQIQKFQSHTAAVNDLSFDGQSEYIASCSDDGSVVVHSLYTEEESKLQYPRPIKTVALDPNYAARKDRQVASAGLAGQLVLSSRGWLGTKDVVLHKGEGPIPRLQWAGRHIAWANDRGVKVYDTLAHQRIGYIERPRGGGEHHQMAAEGRCNLLWESDALLYIGWGACVTVARIVERQTNVNTATRDLSGLGNVSSVGASQRYVEIVAFFQTDYIVAGVAPFGRDLAVLAYIHDATRGPNGAARPELRIVTWDNQEVASDALSLNGFEHYTANDYSLSAFHPMLLSAKGDRPANAPHHAAPAPPGSFRQVTKWWDDGCEPLYYVVSPKDIVMGRPRDGEDRVSWFLEKKRFEDALALIEHGEAFKDSTRERVAQAYLEHLLDDSKFEQAAKLCPRLLKGDGEAWERWVYMFAQARQLPVLAPYIPVQEPRLRKMAYEVVLSSFLPNLADHPGLLSLLRVWPPSGLYSADSMCRKALARMEKHGGSSVMKEVVAELYKMQGKFEQALEMYLSMGSVSVFDFMVQHHLMPTAGRHVPQLISINDDRALQLLVDFWETVSPGDVVEALQQASRDSSQAGQVSAADTWQRQLHNYLHMMFLKDPDATSSYHALQVELYARYDPQSMMHFLSHSQMYPLEEAYETCKERGLVKEMVYILGRMGNAPKALCLIIDELGDIPQAVEFVHDQRDDELWDVLIAHAIHSPEQTAALLQDIGSYCNPLRLLQKIPVGMAVPGLRDNLVKIISDFRTQMSLREGCNKILQMDCVHLARRLYVDVRSAMRRVSCHKIEGSDLKQPVTDDAKLFCAIVKHSEWKTDVDKAEALRSLPVETPFRRLV